MCNASRVFVQRGRVRAVSRRADEIFNDALVAVLVASISPTKFPGVLQGGLPMIDVILTTLSAIATGAGALVAMWLVVSVLYTLGCVMFGWEKPPRWYIPPPR